jgi:eukaryotic-like serine/threonine-protein kinase
MTTTLTADKLAQRALDVGVLSGEELEQVWGEFGTRNVELGPFKQALVRRGLLTNYQLDRLAEGLRTGFFYGDYKVLYGVGAGTFARVYRAAHRVTNELVAIKVLRSRYSRDPETSELFRREGELGIPLKHPNIVAIHEVVSKGSIHYIVMDFVEGRNLRDFYKVRGRFEPLEAARIADGMVAGLNYAFQQGVTHRDLKMSNVIVSSEGVAKLLDFGLAGLGAGDAETTEGGNPRTIDYAGLERATNVRKDDTRSDIFFAGCIFYQLISGRPALAETRERSQRLSKSRYDNIKPVLEVYPQTPLALARVITKAIEFEPQRRYQTPGEMLADLKLAVKRITESKGDDPQDAEVRLEGHDADGQPRRLMVVESDMKMQDLFRNLFKKYGWRVLVTSDPERFFERIYEDVNAADVLLISTGHIGSTALEAFNRLAEQPATKRLPAVVLLGDQQQAWKKHAVTDKHRIVLEMPVKTRALRQAILESVAAAPQ